MHDKILYTSATLVCNRNLLKIVYCVVSNDSITTAKTKLKQREFKMSVAKHQACFTTKLQGQNLATFSHSAVMPIAYLQHTVNTNKTCVNNASIMR